MESGKELIIPAHWHGNANTIWDALRRGIVGDMVTTRRILKSGNRTIVFWKDGTKTIVKRAEYEPDNDYAAYTAAFGIKLYGSNSALKRIVERTEVQKPKKNEGEVLRAIEDLKEGNRAPYTQRKDTEGVTVCPDCGRAFYAGKEGE